VLLRRFEGLWPFDRTFLAPLAAGVVAAAAMWGVRALVPGVGAVVVGVPVGLVAYAGLLRIVGVDPRDRIVVRELADGYRTTLGRRWVGE